jgi:PAS domain S-box-containing protein
VEGVIATWNWGAEQLFGYTTDEALGRSISVIFPPECRSRVTQILAGLVRGEESAPIETQGMRKDGVPVDLALTISPIKDTDGQVIGVSSIAYNITERKHLEEERQKMIEQLNETLSRVKTLSGLLPICASCKKVRDDHGYWQKLEIFVHEHSEAEFSHSICPDCMETLYPQFVNLKNSAKPPAAATGMET